VAEAVRAELEAADQTGGVVLLASASGGTGAGLGSAAAEALRDALPDVSVLGALVCPHETGEVVVHAYVKRAPLLLLPPLQLPPPPLLFTTTT